MSKQETILVGGNHGLEPIAIRATAAGSIPKGARTVIIQNVGAGSATVNGTTLATTEVMEFPPVAGEVYQEIVYTVSTTTLVISGAR